VEVYGPPEEVDMATRKIKWTDVPAPTADCTCPLCVWARDLRCASMKTP